MNRFDQCKTLNIYFEIHYKFKQLFLFTKFFQTNIRNPEKEILINIKIHLHVYCTFLLEKTM